MAETGQPQGTSLTVAQAAEAFEATLTRAEEGQSETETLEGDEPEPEAEEEIPAEEGGDEPEAEEEPEEPEVEPEEEKQPETHVIKVDGVEIPVTLDELKSGYQRDSDYRRKTAALAEERRALEPERAALTAERARVAEQLTALEKVLDKPLYNPAEMDWLRQNNPAEFAARSIEEQRRQNDRNAIAAEKLRLAQVEQAQQAEANTKALQETRAQEEAKLYAAMPEWKDPAKFGPAADGIKKTLQKAGITREEIEGLVDHRAILIAHKAAQWDALQAKAPKAKEKAAAVIKPAKPGVAGQQKSQVTEVTRAKQRLAQTGRVEDAAALFLKRLG